jgi:hypothetical protein
MHGAIARVLGKYTSDVISSIIAAVALSMLAKQDYISKRNSFFKEFLMSFGSLVVAEYIEGPIAPYLPIM